jgi:NADH-quinone oxidoreductase subunit M
MELVKEYILPIITFMPVLGMLAVLILPRRSEEAIRQVAFWAALITFALSVYLFLSFETTAELQFPVKIGWIDLQIDPGAAPITISFQMGVDGISLLLVMLTTFLTPLALLSSWKAIRERVKEYYALFLLLEAGMIGVFLANDLFLFYVFWEIMLVPMYFLIGIWGGGRRIYAAIKFVIFTMVGSLLMLVAILYLAFTGGTFEVSLLIEQLASAPLAPDVQLWLFLAFFLAFAIKVPLFPFHTWLPDAHVEAPTAGSVILAGVLLKMGTYGFVRFCLPMFPDAVIQALPTVMILAIIGIIYAALVAMVQPDVKKLVAYSSVAHLGFVMIGIFSLNMQGLQGAMLQMVNHGLSTGALFLIVGVLYERRHTRLIADYGGISKSMPVFATVFMIITLSSIGLPGLNGFVGEFLTMLGAFRLHWGWGIAAVIGVILAAVYMLWMLQRVIFGKITNEENRNLPDLNWRELAYLLPIVVFVIWIGVYPMTFLEKMEPSLERLLSNFSERVRQVNPEAVLGTAVAAEQPPAEGEEQ